MELPYNRALLRYVAQIVLIWVWCAHFGGMYTALDRALAYLAVTGYVFLFGFLFHKLSTRPFP